MNENKTYNWLKRHGSHVNTQKLADDLDSRFDTDRLRSRKIHKAINWLAAECVDGVLNDREELSLSAISKNALEVNVTQHKRLQKYRKELKFMALDRKCWIVHDYDNVSKDLVPIDLAKQTDLRSYAIDKQTVEAEMPYYNMLSFDKTLESFKTRKLVLYYRGAREETETTQFGCDLFQFAFMYRCIQKLIQNNTFTLFNDVAVVSRTNWLPKQLHNMLPDVKLLKGFNEKFIANTCLHANTIHFFGGELPDAWLFNAPITGSLYDILDYGSKTPNRVSLPFLNYSGTINDKGEYILDTEDEHVVNDEWVSWETIISNMSKYGIESKNDSTHNILNELCKSIDNTEKLLLNDDINYDHVK